MADIIYIVATILFFVGMIAYTAACDRLGKLSSSERSEEKAA